MKHNMLVVIICLGLIAFEVTVYADIMDTPYMTGLVCLLSGVLGWNLGIAASKFTKSLKNKLK